MHQNYVEYPLCKFKESDKVFDENDKDVVRTITGINELFVTMDFSGRIPLTYVNDHYRKVKKE